MQALDTTLPLLAEVETTGFGQPNHGVMKGTTLIRSANGSSLTVPARSSSDTWLTRFAGLPTVTNTPEELAAGIELRNYAIFFGAKKQYSPLDPAGLGNWAWLYRCTDGTVYRLRLDFTLLGTIRPPGAAAVPYVLTAQKFGLIGEPTDSPVTILSGSVSYGAPGGAYDVSPLVFPSPDGSRASITLGSGSFSAPRGEPITETPVRQLTPKATWRLAISAGSAEAVPTATMAAGLVLADMLILGSGEYGAAAKVKRFVGEWQGPTGPLPVYRCEFQNSPTGGVTYDYHGTEGNYPYTKATETVRHFVSSVELGGVEVWVDPFDYRRVEYLDYNASGTLVDIWVDEVFIYSGVTKWSRLHAAAFVNTSSMAGADFYFASNHCFVAGRLWGTADGYVTTEQTITPDGAFATYAAGTALAAPDYSVAWNPAGPGVVFGTSAEMVSVV